MQNSFFSMISRMKHINRWGLMRNTWRETLSEHSLDVAVIAYGLAVIGNTRLQKEYDCDRASVLGIYHDASEIITGDLPTPVKYHNEEIKPAYKKVEGVANQALLDMIPEDMKSCYQHLFIKSRDITGIDQCGPDAGCLLQLLTHGFSQRVEISKCDDGHPFSLTGNFITV